MNFLSNLPSILSAQKSLLSLNLSEDSAINARFTTSLSMDLIRAITQHPTLQQVDLRNCNVTTCNLISLLGLLKQNTNSGLLHLQLGCSHGKSSTNLSIDPAWVDCLPDLKLKSMNFPHHLYKDPQWESEVMPALERNMSLIHVGSWEPRAMNITARNHLLCCVQPYLEPSPESKWHLWAPLLQRLAAEETGESAVYAFLRSRSSELYSTTATRKTMTTPPSEDDSNKRPATSTVADLSDFMTIIRNGQKRARF